MAADSVAPDPFVGGTLLGAAILPEAGRPKNDMVITVYRCAIGAW